jgi:endonuclease/exonuclease/phosphatase family metal-dependent hydrolase
VKGLTLGTWNAGPGSVVDLHHLLDTVHILAGQEMSDRDNFADMARRSGRLVIRGKEPGQSATPLYVDARKCVISHAVMRPMLGGKPVWVGEGAGPATMKPKWAEGGKFRANNEVPFIAVSTHLVASQYTRRRRAVARQHIEDLLLAFDHRRVPVFILGDFNATPKSPVLKKLYRAGWTNTHREAKALPTHGKRTIDYIWWKKDDRVKFIWHETVPTHSDHKALVARFLIGK